MLATEHSPHIKDEVSPRLTTEVNYGFSRNPTLGRLTSPWIHSTQTSITREVLCLLKSHSLPSLDNHSQAIPIPAANDSFLLQGRWQEKLRQDKG